MAEGHIEVSSLCKVNGLTISPAQLQSLCRYVDLLLEWNSKINLISRQDKENIWMRHILHSISVLFRVEFQKSVRLLDLGTGGGLPGLPLAILRPDIEVTLLDSIRKKSLAVESMVSHLEIRNAKIVCGRAGELDLDKMNDVGYDIVIARAVAPVKDLIKWSVMLARKRSNSLGPLSSHPARLEKLTPRMPFLLAMKGGDINDELSSARARFRDKVIQFENLSIKGLRDQDLIDKKIVLVEL